MANWIGMAEACEILAISSNSVRKLIRQGILPAYEVPGIRGPRFHREDVEKLVRRIEPTEAKPVAKGRKKPH
jgi:excisionase family DNA binding protein